MFKHDAVQSASMRRTDIHRRVCSIGSCILAILVVVHTVVSPIAVSADSDFWTDREICRAAAKTYFFLDTKPTDTTDSGQYFGFRSASGNLYTCRIQGERVEFRWLNKSGGTMNSNSTMFRVQGNVLTIQTDMKEEVFSAK